MYLLLIFEITVAFFSDDVQKRKRWFDELVDWTFPNTGVSFNVDAII